MQKQYKSAYRYLRRMLRCGDIALFLTARVLSRLYRSGSRCCRRYTFTWKTQMIQEVLYEDRSRSSTNYSCPFAQKDVWHQER